ncbi:MAG: hypothetical protein LBG13_00475 [Holosporales bacterium]|jgi:hypothetical protein|nr:hypothetical protein [Holosporales bacterium]
MNEIKIASMERQLICAGIHNPLIVNAFTIIDREDFVEPKHKVYAYADIEIPINDLENRFLLRPVLLAKIAEKILALPRNKLLIIGDYLNYTLLVFGRIFSDCSSISEKNLDTYKKEGFDVVFFDSGFYNESILNRGQRLMSAKGMMIFLSRKNPTRFSIPKNLYGWTNSKDERNGVNIETCFRNVFPLENC